MFCPKCSQQQVSDDMRFCSRCGLQLSAVKELLDSNGALATDATENHDNRSESHQKDVNLGAVLMLVGAALAALSTTVMGRPGPPPVTIGGALLVFTAAFVFVLLFSQPLMRAIYKLFSGEGWGRSLASWKLTLY